MNTNTTEFFGLTDSQVEEKRLAFGKNIFEKANDKDFLKQVKEVITEPMFLLLIAACIVYFLVGQYSEGTVMLIAMVFVASISFFQERRSRRALDAVKKLSQPKAKVIRNGKQIEILSEDIVVDDILLIEEGEQVSADGIILKSHDFSVDESLLTGESMAVNKNENSYNNIVYLGSTIRTGNAFIKVTHIGFESMLGKMGKAIEEMKPVVSRFQKEIRSFIRLMAIAGVVAFLIVFTINYFKEQDFLLALLFALTLAMSILPEEIPVAYSTFMALGSRRLLKENVLAKDPQVVETLGSATVICIDKTGTITENRMSVASIYSYSENSIYSADNWNKDSFKVLTYSMWASEPAPFDPMEVAIHEAYQKYTSLDERHDYTLIHEYPLSGAPPMMTHIYCNNKRERIIACKGGAESVVRCSKLNDKDTLQVLNKVKEMASSGYRVLGVASANFASNDYPFDQKDFNWKFEGLIGLYDPPKKNIKEVLNKFYEAGVKVKIISGDYPETTRSIAKEINFKGSDEVITGKEVSELDDLQLREIVKKKNIFSRMFPDAKLRVVNALKANGEIVAMTGDGVNDGPALKAADIGVSMGSKGTEIAKRAASLVLLNNDLDKMYFAIISGRNIYFNLKKAIRYILSIHIPIITIVTAPLLFNWDYTNIFSPIHIIFFELIMGPTCSIIYENEPVELNGRIDKPHIVSAGFLSLKEISLSVLQGLFISVGVLLLYYFAMNAGYSMPLTRTLVFATIVFANILLTLENRSFKDGIFRSIKYKNSMIYFIVTLSVILLFVILTIPFLRKLFLFESISMTQGLICIGCAFISVAWIELIKVFRK